MTSYFFHYFPPDFPIEDTIEIGARLEESGGLVPGFIPPPVGLLDIRGLIYCQKFDHRSIIVLPDRNLVSRMAQVARYGAPAVRDKTSDLAIDLMAFCQAMDINFEPSIAYHELAHVNGNAEARDELSWFRASDRGAPQEWVELAQGRLDRIELGQPDELDERDLAFPLRRWRRNYIVALKIAELELLPIPPLEKVARLYQWMWDDFILAGSAAVFAAVYFAPNARRKRLIKYLRSPDRARALEGVKNAAWDITHLSEFVARTGRSDEAKERVILATADAGLARIAPLTMGSLVPSDDQVELVDMLDGWRPSEAEEVVSRLQSFFINGDPRPPIEAGPSFIDDLSRNGEATILSWTDR